MASYLATVRTPRSPEEVFDYLANLSNFAQWDPGVTRASQVVGDGPGPGAAFDVTVKGFPRPVTLRYHIIDHDRPHRVVAEAVTRSLTSLDTITVAPDGEDPSGGAVVTYDARLSLNGIFSAFDPILARAFNRIGDRAATGLAEALDGEQARDALG